jgi:hypothetical protein
MFIGRRLDGTIYGCWTVKQPDDENHQRQEELPDDHPDVIAFLAPRTPDPRIVADDNERDACKADGALLTLINQTRSEWATWAAANFPTLTAAERTRIGIICWMLAVSIRRLIR